MIVRKKRTGIIILLSLLLCGCAGEEQTVSPAPSETVQPAPTGTESSDSPLSRVRASEDVMAVLENAWDRGGEHTSAPVTMGQNAADVMAVEGDILYILQNKSVLVCRGGGGTLEVLTSLEVGEDWTEENTEKQWGGHEKQPVALCALRGRLAVISEYSEYYNAETEDGGWLFRDYSYCTVDLFDTEDAENIVPMAMYGQSGSFGCALVLDGRLYVATRRQLFEEDFAKGSKSPLPFLRSGQEEKPLSWDSMECWENGSGWYTLLCAYSPYNGVRLDSRALIGGGERMIMDNTGLTLLRGDPAETVRYSFFGEKLNAGENEMMEQSADKLMESAFRGECWQEDTASEGEAEWSCPWGEAGRLELRRTKTGLLAVLCEDGNEVCRLPLGYDFQAAPEEALGIYTDSETGLLGLPAEDGWAFWRLENGEWNYLHSLFSPDHSENRRCFLWGGSLYAADTRRVFAIDGETLDILGEWSL